jgi:hypothetical protein
MSTEERLGNMEEKVDSIDHAVKEMRDALLGTPFSEARGFVHRLNDMEKRMQYVEKVFNQGKWLFYGMMIMAGFGVPSFLNTIGSFIFKIFNK